jgi:hypothetical protein
MPTNTESLNRELFRLLSKYKPKPLDAEGKATPVPDEADIFKFEFTKDGEDYGTVYVTLDEDRVLTVYFGDDVTESPSDKTPGVDYDDTWTGLLQQLSAWRMTKGLRGFKTQNKDRVGDDMARRNHMRNKDKIAEGYYPMGKKASYSDAVPSVKIVIEHSRVIEEGEQRYRNINRIFLENQLGERYLLDTKKPGIARVYARHIAEGGKVNDDRWSHIGSLCEEYQKMAGFVRATRNGQFNESAQSLVNEGIAHYESLRESLGRLTGKRGYNAYFENWTPSLMEDGTEESNLNELFVQETLDPRIESVMPILNRIHKKVSESTIDKEINKLAEWADSLTEEESIKSNNPGGIPEEEELEEAIHTGAALQKYRDNRFAPQNKYSNLSNRGVNRGINRAADDFDRFMDLDQAESPHSKTQHQQDTKQRLKTKPMAGPKGHLPEQAMAEDSHEEQVRKLAAYNERMAGENPPIDLGLREVGNWAKVGHYGDPIKTAWYNIAKYGIRNNKFNDSVDKAMTAIGDFPDKYDLSIPEIDALYSAYETVYDQWEQSKSQQGMAEDLDANQNRVGQLGPTEKVKNNNIGKLVGANENFINQADQAVTTEDDEMAEGILDNIKNMFKPKDPTPVTPITADDIAKGYQTQPEFKAQVDQIAKQQGISPQELIKQLQQQAGGGVAQNASVPTQAFHEGLMDTLKKGVQGVKKFGQDAKAAGKEAWDEVGPMLKHDWKHPIQAAMAKEGEMDEGTHTQYDSDLNPNDYKRKPTDWSVDPIEAGTDRIHNKVASMLDKLKKPASKPLDKNKTSLGSTVLDEMDKSQPSAGRDSGPREGPEKEAKPVSKEKATKDASDILSKSMDKAHKKDVKEGQEDLDTIIRLIRK